MQQSERLYFTCSIFTGVKKRLETRYQIPHLVQNICISVYLYDVLGNFQGYILTHGYDTIDVLLNFKNISPLTSSTITMTGLKKWKYVNLNISGAKQVLRIKKHNSYFWKGIWHTINVLILRRQSITQPTTLFRFNV